MLTATITFSGWPFQMLQGQTQHGTRLNSNASHLPRGATPQTGAGQSGLSQGGDSFNSGNGVGRRPVGPGQWVGIGPRYSQRTFGPNIWIPNCDDPRDHWLYGVVAYFVPQYADTRSPLVSNTASVSSLYPAQRQNYQLYAREQQQAISRPCDGDNFGRNARLYPSRAGDYFSGNTPAFPQPPPSGDAFGYSTPPALPHRPSLRPNMAQDVSPDTTVDLLTSVVWDLNEYWDYVFRSNGWTWTYVPPSFVYSPGDFCEVGGVVNYDPNVPYAGKEYPDRTLQRDFGNLGVLFGIAHEISHHVQELRGWYKPDPQQYPDLAKARELSADQMAGSYLKWAQSRGLGLPNHLDIALTAAFALGDRNPGCRSDPHGSPEERRNAVLYGYQHGPFAN